MGLGLWGSGFRALGFMGLALWGLGCRGLGFRGVRFRFQRLGFRVRGLGLKQNLCTDAELRPPPAFVTQTRTLDLACLP